MRFTLRFGGFQFFFRQRRKRATWRLKSASVRPPIRETLASRTLHSKRGTFAIVEAKFNAVIETEIIFGKVAMQMLLAAVLINAAHAALED